MVTRAHPAHGGHHRFPGASPSALRPGSRKPLGRARHFVARALAVLVMSALALVVVAVICLNTPPVRRLVAEKVNAALASSFRGKVRIGRLGGLGLGGVSDVDVTVDDPTGRRVLTILGVRLRVDSFAAGRTALFGRKGPILVRLSDVRIEDVDALLDTDQDGQLLLANAFAPPKPSKPADPNARGLVFIVQQASLAHARAHRQTPGSTPLDVELDGFRGAFTSAPDLLDAAVDRARITGHGVWNGRDITGALTAHLRKTSDPRGKVEARVDWNGAAGDVAVSTHLEGQGTLPDVDVGLKAGFGAAALEASGRVYAGDDAKRATLTLRASDVDLHEFTAGAPRSSLGLAGRISAEKQADGTLAGDVALTFLGGRFANASLPSASIRAHGSRTAPNRIRGGAEVLLNEPGAPTHLRVSATPNGESSTLRFALESRAAELARVPELRQAVRGSLSLAATGTVDLSNRSLDARLGVQAAGIEIGSSRVQTASVDAQASGKLTSPSVDVALRSRGLSTGGLQLTSLDARAAGPVRQAHVEAHARGPDVPDVDASADVGLKGAATLRDVRLLIARGRERAVITARSVASGNGDLRVEDARIEGLGAPTRADLLLARRELRIRAESTGLDLARVGRLAHWEDRLKSGIVSFDSDLDLRPDGGRGRLMLDVRDVTVAKLPPLAAHVEATLDDRTVAGRLGAKAGELGALNLDIRKLALARGGPMSVASWRGAFGYVALDGRLDLTRLEAAIPPGDFPLSEARGVVIIDGHIARDDVDDVTPDVQLDVKTDGLAIAPKTPATRDIDGVFVMPRPPWHLEGVDFDVDARIDGDSGRLQLSTTARDNRGELARLNANAARPPFGEIFHASGRLPVALRRTSFDVALVVPERGLGTMPPLLRQPYATGRLTAAVHATGTLLSPQIEVGATLRRSRFASNANAAPVDLDLLGRYDGRHGRLLLEAAGGGRQLADVDVQAEAPAAGVLEGNGSSWTASARAHFDGFPLEALPLLEDKQIAGLVRGDLWVSDLHRDAHAGAALDVDGLRVASFGYRSARLEAKADGRGIDARVRVDQGDGYVDARAQALATWGAAVAPALDPGQPLTFTAAAKNFRIGVLLPFVDGFVDELDGRIDADTRLVLDPRARAARMSGTLALSRGAFEAAAGGGEFHDVAANLKFAPDGTIVLEKLTASGLNGHLEANATAKIEGTTLAWAKGVVLIPSSSPIPLSGGGSDLGNIDGRFVIAERSTAGGKNMDVDVDVPQLRVALPEGSSGNAQSLGPIPKARIGSHRGTPRKFVLLPLDSVKKPRAPSSGESAKLRMQAHLGNVEVVRGTQLKVDLTGQVNVDSAQNSEVGGQIRLKKGGQLAVQGKNFTIDSGTVTFVGDDPSNPEVVVKAGWKAPDGSVVYANFVGPLKTGKVTLTSEPPLPQQEIVQLVLFGTASGKQAQSPQANTETSAIGTVGGEAAQPLNHALRQLGLGAVTASVDTSQSANPKPEVEVQIAKDISLQIAVVLGQPPPGVNPDRTLLTLDWRFMSRWSLASTLGDAGTTIFDVLWQRRY